MINNIVLMGRITANPELRTTNSGISVVSFTLAVERRFQPKNGEKVTDFIDCVAWKTTAEFIEKWFSKGDMLAVTGELQTRTYTDKNGNNRKAVEVQVEQASFCGGKNSGNNATPAAEPAKNQKQNTYNSGYAEVAYDDGDLPF